MYISQWLIITIIIVFFIFKYKNKSNPITAEKLENWFNSINPLKEEIIKPSSLLEIDSDIIGYSNGFEEEIKIIDSMFSDTMRLRERYRYDLVKQKQVIQDYLDVLFSFRKIKYAKESFSCDYESGCIDRFSDKMKAPCLLISEVANRIYGELGDTSEVKKTIDDYDKSVGGRDYSWFKR